MMSRQCQQKFHIPYLTAMMRRDSFFARQLFWGIRIWQLLAFAACYVFFALQYWLAIWITSDRTYNIFKDALIDYLLLKSLFTAPLWWLYFIKWKDKSLRFKLSMHLVTGPAWVFCWFHSYRFIQDLRGAAYLRGNGIWWDIYIPGLVYCLQFAVFHVYDFYLQTQKQKEKEKALLHAAYASEVNALKAQIQPHFLFITLNSISASVPENMEHTREMIAKLADTFRYSLKASEQEWITLEEELNFTRITLDLEKERLKNRLEVYYAIDSSLLQATVPPMLLQPITENAIKHGIAPRIDGGKITIAVQKKEGKINICISDTGIGYDRYLDHTIFEKGIGLRNTRQRLEKLYGETITVSKNSPSGLAFSFNIPL